MVALCVLAIIITIMVLEMKVPHGTGIEALRPLWPVFLSYALSFVNIGIYWNNHHHMFHLCPRVGGGVMWAMGNDIKGKISPILYLVAIPLAFINEWVAGALYVLVALLWLIPDRRIERAATADRS